MNKQQSTTSIQNHLSPATRKLGQQIVDHQCWAMGKDVRHSNGNLLCSYGFVRVCCIQGGLTQYELRNGLVEGGHVFLWGFGMFFGNEEEGTFLPRSSFTPFRTQGPVELHNKETHPFSDQSFDSGLLLQGIAWLIEYEQWVARSQGQLYRQKTFEDFPRLLSEHRDLTVSWHNLSQRITDDKQRIRCHLGKLFPRNPCHNHG